MPADVTPDGLLKLSDASRRCSISVDTLRMLAVDGLLPQAVRGRAGNYYLPHDNLPTWRGVVDVLRAQLLKHLKAAASAVARVERETEAVRYDIAAAVEDPEAPLGTDLEAMPFGSRAEHPMVGALSQLQMLSLEAKRYHVALREALKSG